MHREAAEALAICGILIASVGFILVFFALMERFGHLVGGATLICFGVAIAYWGWRLDRTR